MIVHRRIISPPDHSVIFFSMTTCVCECESVCESVCVSVCVCSYVHWNLMLESPELILSVA